MGGVNLFVYFIFYQHLQVLFRQVLPELVLIVLVVRYLSRPVRHANQIDACLRYLFLPQPMITMHTV